MPQDSCDIVEDSQYACNHHFIIFHYRAGMIRQFAYYVAQTSKACKAPIRLYMVESM